MAGLGSPAEMAVAVDQLVHQQLGGEERSVGGEEGLLIQKVVLDGLRGENDQGVPCAGPQFGSIISGHCGGRNAGTTARSGGSRGGRCQRRGGLEAAVHQFVEDVKAFQGSAGLTVAVWDAKNI